RTLQLLAITQFQNLASFIIFVKSTNFPIGKLFYFKIAEYMFFHLMNKLSTKMLKHNNHLNSTKTNSPVTYDGQEMILPTALSYTIK
ncbi:MAG: hypothetical protein ACOVNR_09340, partial [Chitinophagaceae bacterium]